jgi:hypothetical protein
MVDVCAVISDRRGSARQSRTLCRATYSPRIPTRKMTPSLGRMVASRRLVVPPSSTDHGGAEYQPLPKGGAGRRHRFFGGDVMDAFEQGKADYRAGLPRPPIPSEEECRTGLTPEGVRYFGWMIARAYDIDKIIRELDLAGVRYSDEGFGAAWSRSTWSTACYRSASTPSASMSKQHGQQPIAPGRYGPAKTSVQSPRFIRNRTRPRCNAAKTVSTTGSHTIVVMFAAPAQVVPVTSHPLPQCGCGKSSGTTNTTMRAKGT